MLTAAMLVRWWKQTSTESSWTLPGWVWRVSLSCFALIGITLLVAVPLIAGWISLSPLEGRTLPAAAWLLPLALVPFLFGWLCWKQWNRNQVGWGVAAILLGSMILTASLGAWGPVIADQERASKPLAKIIHDAMGNDDVRIGTHPRYYRPSIVFYLQREIIRCTSEKQALDMLKTRVPTFMLVPAREWQSMATQLDGQYSVLKQLHDFTAGQEILLISNQGPEKVKNSTAAQ